MDAVYRLACDRQVTRYMFLPADYRREDAESFVRLARSELRKSTGHHFVLVEKLSGNLLGAVGISNISGRHRRGELGFWLGRANWGKGLASEAVARVLGFGFGELGLRRVHATVISGNDASMSVLERAGFRREGLHREHLKHRGRWRDLESWGLLGAEWRAR